MVNTVMIRPATLADTPAVTVLAGQLGYPAPEEEVRRRLERVLANPEHAVWVAEQDQVVVGWVNVYVLYEIADPPLVFVAGLVVDEKRRGQGIGRALMGRVEQWAVEHGCHEVQLRSRVTRVEAHRFYESIGYEEFKVAKAFRKRMR